MKNKIKAIVALSICAIVAGSSIIAVSVSAAQKERTVTEKVGSSDISVSQIFNGDSTDKTCSDVTVVYDENSNVIAMYNGYRSQPDSDKIARLNAEKEAETQANATVNTASEKNAGNNVQNDRRRGPDDEYVRKNFKSYDEYIDSPCAYPEEQSEEWRKRDMKTIDMVKEKTDRLDSNFKVDSIENNDIFMHTLCQILNGSERSNYTDKEIDLMEQYLKRQYYDIINNIELQNEVKTTVDIPYVD